MPEIGRLFIILGLFFNFIAAICLFRMPDVYIRLQSAARSVTLGTGCIMLGVFICRGFSATGFKALFVTAFLILVCPVCVHALARGTSKRKTDLFKSSQSD